MKTTQITSGRNIVGPPISTSPTPMAIQHTLAAMMRIRTTSDAVRITFPITLTPRLISPSRFLVVSNTMGNRHRFLRYRSFDATGERDATDVAGRNDLGNYTTDVKCRFMAPFDQRATSLVALGVGGIGLLLALALEADIAFSSGLWYPIVYAGTPAIAATAAFARERPNVGRVHLFGIGVWLLVSSVLALVVAVVLSLGFPSEVPELPVSAVLSAGLLYVGFLLAPVALAVVAVRHRGLRTVLAPGLSPFAQAAIAAVLIVLA